MERAVAAVAHFTHRYNDDLVRIKTLEAAIRKHRDQRGDDRCWLDDMELYAVLGEPIHPNILALPPRETFLGNCARYFECRQRHADPAEAEKEYKGQS